MALTKNLKRIGRAAQAEKQDFQEYLDATYEQERIAKREALREEDYRVWIELCEKDPGGEAWYADDNNVPEHGGTRSRIELVRSRIQLVEALHQLIGKVDADIYLLTSPTMEQLRRKLETIKDARSKRDRGCLHQVVTGDLQKSLNDMTPAEQADWFRNVEEVEF